MEDPIEAVVPGVGQAQVNLAAGLTLESGLKSLLRQDPEVIAIGEIRDKATAEIALQAALDRPFNPDDLPRRQRLRGDRPVPRHGDRALRGAEWLGAVVAQRLVRRLCDCALPTSRSEDFLGLPVFQAKVLRGCDVCRRTGYIGRTVLAEMLLPESDELARAVLRPKRRPHAEQIAADAGMIPRWERACAAVEDGIDVTGRGPPHPRRHQAAAANPCGGEVTRN